MVLGVQSFDTVAAHAGGAPVLPLDTLLGGIGAQPAAPQFWWVYALPLSTMLPSLFNLAIAGIALVRGLPGLAPLLLSRMPAGAAVLSYDRTWMSLVLAAEVFVGAAFGIAAQGFLVVVVIGYVLPWFGLDLLGLAEGVAALDLPRRALVLVGVF